MRHTTDTAEFSVLNLMVNHFQLDFALVGPKLLFVATKEALHLAFQWLLVTKGVDAQSRDEKGRNILHIAIMSNQMFMVHLIDGIKTLQGGKDINVPALVSSEDHGGMNVLHYLVMTNDEPLYTMLMSNPESDIAKNVYSAGKFVEIIDRDTPLERKIERRMTEWTDSKGRTARDYAVLFKRVKFVEHMDKLAVHFKVHELTTHIDECIIDGQKPELFHFYTQEFSELVASRNLTVDITNLSPHNVQALHRHAFEFTRMGLFETGVLWLVNTFHFTPSLSKVDLFHKTLVFQTDLITQCLKGPRDQNFEYSDINYYDEGTPLITLDNLSATVHRSLFEAAKRHWDGERDLCELILSFRGEEYKEKN
eukprot:gene41534-51447_t